MLKTVHATGNSMRVHVTRSGIGGVYGHPATRCDAGGCAAGTELYWAGLVPSQWKEGDIADVEVGRRRGRPAPMPLEVPEEIRDLLNDLIEWEYMMGGWESPIWKRVRAIRKRLVVK